jgi:hypothetical protein
MKRALLFLSLQLFLIRASAQSWNWAAQTTNSTALEEGKKICEDQSGNSYVLGTLHGNTLLSGNLTAGYFVAKFDPEGVCMWSKNLPGDLRDISANNNELYVIGSFTGSLSVNSTTYISHGFSDILLMKLDAVNGNFIWIKTEGGSGNEDGKDIVTDPLGNFYIAVDYDESFYLGSIAVAVDTLSNGLCAKADQMGNYVWARTVHSVYTPGYTPSLGVTDLVLDNNYRIYMAGHYFRGMRVDSIFANAEWGGVYVCAFDLNGNLEDFKPSLPGYYFETIFADNEHKLYIILKFGNQYGYGYILGKYTEDFTQIFVKSYYTSGGVMPHIPVPVGGAVDQDRNVYFVYNFTDSVQLNTDTNYIYANGDQNILIEKLDSAGSYLAHFTTGNADSITCNAVSFTSPGKIHFIGSFKDPVAFGAYTLTPDGPWPQFFAAELDVTALAGINTTVTGRNNLQLYPNPNTGNFIVAWNAMESEALIYIQDMVGHTVFETHSKTGQINIALPLSPGMYLLSVKNDKTIVSKKLLITN